MFHRVRSRWFFGFCALLAFVLVSLPTLNCLVEPRCYQNEDCRSPRICNARGQCVHECENDADCGPGFVCEDHVCQLGGDGEPLPCPEDMVSVQGVYCIDIYEASRPDATATDPGVDASRAVSQAGVLPWSAGDNATFNEACELAGKTLCTPSQWAYACGGSADGAYAYGNRYEPQTCNGIDAFGQGNHHLAPTGSFPDCTSPLGVFDLNGNVWEHVLGGDETQVRGGAYNCSKSEWLHRCDFIPQSWAPSAIGFRCCLSEPAAQEAGL